VRREGKGRGKGKGREGKDRKRGGKRRKRRGRSDPPPRKTPCYGPGLVSDTLFATGHIQLMTGLSSSL